MISLTRLNGKRLVINADQIRTVEETPDTMITLMNGDQIIVSEDLKVVVCRAVEYGQSLRKLMSVS
jgi:flagellar protein FlbD